MKRILILAAALGLLSGPALAQNSLANFGNAVAVIGRDTSTGYQCLIGTTATCALPGKGGGGAVTGGVGAFLDGWDVTEGFKADAPCASSVTACSVEARLADIEAQTTGTKNAANAPIPAGSAIIGKVGIDQTTPGTTNGVSVTNFPATQNTAPLSNPVGTAGWAGGAQSITALSGTAALIANARAGAPGTGRVSITIVQKGTTALSLTSTAAGAEILNLPGTVGASVTVPTTSAVYGFVASGTASINYYENY